jgi:calcium-dependent protein kinase
MLGGVVGFLLNLGWFVTCGLCGTPPEVEAEDPDAAAARSPLLGLPAPAAAAAAEPLNTSNILGLGRRDVAEDYELGELLGQGAFGAVRRCTHRTTREAFACKSVVKAQLRRRADVEDVRREVQILMMLSGHPAVAALVAVYEDAAAVHMVLELCEGGTLLDHVAALPSYSERAAAQLFAQMLDFVHHCHVLGVVHRDVKPSQFLLGPGGAVKAVDFGLSQFYRRGRDLRSLVGSIHYVAPEVLQRRYSSKADVWSLGVCLYVLLSGRHPFWGETEEAVFAAVLRGEPDLASDPWPAVSAQAKDMVRRMLDRDVARRPSAEELRHHSWLGMAPDRPLDASVQARLSALAAGSRVRREQELLRATADEATECIAPASVPLRAGGAGRRAGDAASWQDK